ncbi:hypothetical protein V1515DRAFT_578926 [Lipomyces mesembrius]
MLLAAHQPTSYQVPYPSPDHCSCPLHPPLLLAPQPLHRPPALHGIQSVAQPVDVANIGLPQFQYLTVRIVPVRKDLLPPPWPGQAQVKVACDPFHHQPAIINQLLGKFYGALHVPKKGILPTAPQPVLAMDDDALPEGLFVESGIVVLVPGCPDSNAFMRSSIAASRIS